MNNKRIAVALGLVFVPAFSLNFVWENLHAYLYVAETMPYLHLYCAFVDALLITAMYIAVAVVWKDKMWIKNMIKVQVFVFAVIGLVIAVIIEVRAVYVLQKWSYSSLMPTVFGIGFTPLVQLSVTGLVALWIAILVIENRNV